MFLFKLMVVNPEKIILIRGEEETGVLWQSHNLYHELGVKVSRSEVDYLTKKMNQFFGTFSNSFFISYKDQHQKDKKILISFKGFVELDLNPENVISTQIKSNYLPFSYRKTNGLSLMSPDVGVTTWAVYSAPTYVAKKFYEYYNDSFSILEMAINEYDWLIRHCYKSVDKEDLYKEDCFNFLTGEHLKKSEEVFQFLNKNKKYLRPIDKPQVDHGNQLFLGAYADLSGNVRDLGEGFKSGLALRYNKENILYGGVFNKFLRLIFLDDFYNQSVTLEQLRKLINIFKTDVFTGMGTRTSYAASGYCKENNASLFFPYTGAPGLRRSDLKSVINLRASYGDEAVALVDYAVKKLGKNRVAIFYQDDAYGKASRDPSVKRLKEKYKIKDVLEVAYPTGSLKMDKAAEEINSFCPAALFFFSTSVAARELIETMGVKNLVNVSLLSISPLTQGFLDYLKTKGLTSVLSQAFPNPHGNIEIAREFTEAVKTFMPSDRLNADAFEGYIGASLLIEAMKKVGPDITKDKIMNYCENIKNVDYKGLKLNFDPDLRQLLHTVWLDIGEKEWINIDLEREKKLFISN